MNFFEIVLAPFFFIIKYFFLLSYELTGNYGISIIMLSFIISAILLPVFIFIEKIKKQNDVVKLKMQPIADEIKRCYKGQERYYYIQTLHRQANYSPFLAVLPAFSLLLQIPFFIAAYWFLESYTLLGGIKFGFINDLSKPDALFGNIHALPIIMTLVNLITAFFYTRHGNSGERKQMVIVAGIFLVLLFNLPSGLVLYWTMNNIFSFFRLFITNKEAFTRKTHKENTIQLLKQVLQSRLLPAIPKLLKASITFFIIGLIYLLITFFINGSDVLLDNVAVVGTSITIALVSIAVLCILHAPLPILNSKRIKIFYTEFLPVYKSMFLLILIAGAGSQLYWAYMHSFKTIVQRLFLIAIASGIVTIVLAHITLYFQGSFDSFLKQNLSKKGFTKLGKRLINLRTKPTFYFSVIFAALYLIVSGFAYYNEVNLILLSFGLLMFVLAIASTPSFIKNVNSSLVINDEKIKSRLYIVSVFYIISLVLFWNPLLVYSSFPETFSFPAHKIFIKNLLPFCIVFFVSIIVYFSVPLKLKKLLTIIATTTAIVFFLNIFIFPVNVGTLQLGKYIKAANLAMNPTIYLAEMLFLIILFATFVRLTNKKYVKKITVFILAITFVAANQSIITAISSDHFYTKPDQRVNLPNTISFSKDKPNVVYFIADMFMGMHIKYLLEDDPQLKTKLDGFIWYPNTLSVSTNTAPSISSILKGHSHNLDQLNLDGTRTMAEKINDASIGFTNKVKSKGYRFTSTHMVYTTMDKNMYDAYLPNWHSDWNKFNSTLNIGGTKEIDFSILSKNALFFGLPLSIKPLIYKGGDWIKVENETNKNTSLTQKLNFIRLLPHLSDTLTSESSFIYIHSLATHGPWHIVDDNGQLEMNVSSYENQKWFLNHFVKWINWMKENEVYDNTKIVLLSDHSHYLPKNELKNFGDEFKWREENEKLITAEDFWRVNALLMVKDYNQNHELNLDWRFMSNADGQEIAFNKNNLTKVENPSPRELPVFIVGNIPRSTKKRYLEISRKYVVKDSVFDPNNWKEIK